MPIEVWNPSSTDAQATGVATHFTFDHSRFVQRGARLDGKDVRLYSVRGAQTKQLHRVLGPESSWNKTNTKLWFRLDGPISALGTQGDTYFLVFEEQTPEPLSDPNQVFALYDDFNASTLDETRWETKTKASAPGVVQSIEQSNGELALDCGPSGAGLISAAGIRSRSPINLPGLIVEASIRFEMHLSRDDCTLENLMGLWSHQEDRARAIWQRGGDRWYILNDTDSSSVARQRLSADPETGVFRRYVLKWTSPTLSAFADTFRQGQIELSSTSFTLPSAGALNLGFNTHSDGVICTTRESRLWVDWVLVRQSSSDTDLRSTFKADQEVTKF